MMADPMKRLFQNVPAKEKQRLLSLERKFRASGQWGEWEMQTFLPGTVGLSGWLVDITTAYKNRVFAILHRPAEAGVHHLAVSSLSGIRPTWHEMQRIKNDLAGPDCTAIEVYPAQRDVVDEADMFHIWVLRGKLPFGLHVKTRHGLRSPVEVGQ
jgi:hypothetical protein